MVFLLRRQTQTTLRRVFPRPQVGTLNVAPAAFQVRNQLRLQFASLIPLTYAQDQVVEVSVLYSVAEMLLCAGP